MLRSTVSHVSAAGCLIILAMLATTAQADLVGFYSFDDAGDPRKDESLAGGNDLTSVGADPTYEAAGGFQGGAYNFNGAQRLIAPIDINPTTLPEVTIGAWVRTDSLAAGLRKVIGHDTGAWDRVIGLDNRAGSFRYTAFTGTNNNGPVDGTPGPNNTTDWTFLAATFDATTVTVYVDVDASTTGDALVAVSEAAQMGPGFATTSIGSLRPDNTAEGWVGSIDNVFFYDEVLSEAEITVLRDGGKSAFVIPEPGTVTLAAFAAAGLLAFGRRRRRRRLLG